MTANLSCGACGLRPANVRPTGTAGCMVAPADAKSTKRYLLTCCHVVEAAGVVAGAIVDDHADDIGTVFRHVDRPNTDGIDAALVELSDPDSVLASIPGLGIPTGWVATPTKDMQVWAYSRVQAGLRAGIVDRTGYDVKLGNLTYRGQLRCSQIASDGDSGTLVVNSRGRIVGIVCGIEVDGGKHWSIVTPIDAVRTALGIGDDLEFVIGSQPVHLEGKPLPTLPPPIDAPAADAWRPATICRASIAAECRLIFDKYFPPYRPIVLEVAGDNGLPPCILAAIGAHETNWDVKNPGYSGGTEESYGFMQISKKFHPDFFVDANAWSNPAKNVLEGAKIYKDSLKQVPEWIATLDQRYRLAAIYYNSGPDPKSLPDKGAGEEALKRAIDDRDAKTTARNFDGIKVSYGQSVMERASWFFDQGVR